MRGQQRRSSSPDTQGRVGLASETRRCVTGHRRGIAPGNAPRAPRPLAAGGTWGYQIDLAGPSQGRSGPAPGRTAPVAPPITTSGTVAQGEREATAERTSAALQVLKQQGHATGGVAPYGFQFSDGRRAWHQGEQETLAAIIEHRAAGLSWAKVADKLNAAGHRTRTGGQWTRQGAHQVHQAREREHGAAA